jgi:outer membrane protein assembly factor BamB
MRPCTRWPSRTTLVATIAIAALALPLASRASSHARTTETAPLVAKGSFGGEAPFSGPGPTGVAIPRWRMDVNWPSDVAVADGTVFVADEDAAAAIDLDTGALVWRVVTGLVVQGPVVVDDVVFVRGADLGLLALDRRTGVELWRNESVALADALTTDPVGSSGSVLVQAGSERGGIGSLDAASGKEKWWFEPATTAPAIVHVASEGSVFLHLLDEAFVVLDATNGQERWRTEKPGGVVIGSDTVFIVLNGALRALDAITGRERWSVPVPTGMQPVAEGEGTLFVVSGDSGSGPVVTLALDAGDGRQRWRIEREALAIGPIVDGSVYAVKANDEVLALDAVTGAERWRQPVSDANRVETVVDGVVYVTVLAIFDWSGVVALDGASGREHWRFRTGQFPHVPAVVDRHVVALDEAGTLWVLGGADDPVPPRPEAPPPAPGENPGWGGRSYPGPGPAGAGELRWQIDGTTARSVGDVIDDAIVVGSIAPGSGSSVASLDAATGEARWRIELADYVDKVFVADDGTVVVSVTDGLMSDTYVLGLDGSTGQEFWRLTAPAGLRGLADVAVEAAGAVIVAFTEPMGNVRAMVAVETSTGRERWRIEPEGPTNIAAAVEGSIFLGCPPFDPVSCVAAEVVALDAGNGQVRWRAQTDGLAVVTGITAGIVCVSVDDGTILALDAESGTERWRTPVGGSLFAEAAVGGTIYATSDRSIQALDATTGQERWSMSDGQVEYVTAVAEGTVYAIGYDVTPDSSSFDQGSVYAIDATTGRERWRAWLDSAEVVAAVVDGTVYAWDSSDTVVAFDAVTGAELWRVELPVEGEVLYVRGVAGGVIYLVAENGPLVGIGGVDGSGATPIAGRGAS